MRKIILAVFMMTMLIFGTVSAEESPKWVKDLEPAKNATQMVVVAGIGDTTAWISMHEKDSSGNWQQVMTTPGFIGKKGLGKVKEGDNKTPVGVFHFNKAFGIAPDPGCEIPYKQVDENIYWSSDFNYKYNEMIDLRDYPNLDTTNSEHIIDYNPKYIYCLSISYNEEGTPNRGSAIFMNCFDSFKPYTGGCVAIPEDKMLFVMKNVKKDCVVVIDSLKNLSPETYKELGL